MRIEKRKGPGTVGQLRTTRTYKENFSDGSNGATEKGQTSSSLEKRGGWHKLCNIWKEKRERKRTEISRRH